MKRIRRILAIILTLCILFTGTVVFAKTENEDINFLYLESIKDYILQYHKGDVEENTILQGAIKNIIKKNPELVDQAIEGMFNTLDTYSTFLAPDQFGNFVESVDGQFGGIGISVTNKDGYITILSPIDDTPGKRVGLKSGDRIIYVDGEDVSDFDVDIAVPLLRGAPGTLVRLGIQRDGNDEILYYDIIREVIKVNPISHEIKKDNIGYIRITDFNANTEEYLSRALKDFDEKRVEKLIIDIRNNPGGSLEQVVEVANHFIPDKGPIVYIDYKEGKKDSYYSNLVKAKYKLVVLINEGSASASEILAGAIQDSGAGKIVGIKSFGKGTVQVVSALPTGGAIKMTIAKYLTPKGRMIDGDGIHPDIKVENIVKNIDMTQFRELTYTVKPNIGYMGSDVLAAEQRLRVLGYDVGEPDEIYDEKTFEAVKTFQEEQNLFPYGVLDFTTQEKLNQKTSEIEILIDKQLEKALELLSGK